jgi:hypothetical protein
VVVHLPTKARPEVEEDLKSMITELLEARCGDREPTETDIRVVLTELGPPAELALKYSGDADKALISGIYLHYFKWIARIVVPVAAAAGAIIAIPSGFIDRQSDSTVELFLDITANTLIQAFFMGLQAFAWLLLVFYLLERSKVRFTDMDYLANLPTVPDRRDQISLSEPIFSIIITIVGTVFILGFPHLIAIYSKSNPVVPIFNTTYITASWYLIIIMSAAGIAREIVKLVERRHSKRLALATVGTNIVNAIAAIVFFSGSQIMNPALADGIRRIFGSDFDLTPHLDRIITIAPLALIALTVFALLIEVCVSTIQAWRFDRYTSSG